MLLYRLLLMYTVGKLCVQSHGDRGFASLVDASDVVFLDVFIGRYECDTVMLGRRDADGKVVFPVGYYCFSLFG